MLDTDGYVSEGTGENIFIVRDGLIKTTPITTVLEGITRNCVLNIAKRNNIQVVEQKIYKG